MNNINPKSDRFKTRGSLSGKFPSGTTKAQLKKQNNALSTYVVTFSLVLVVAGALAFDLVRERTRLIDGTRGEAVTIVRSLSAYTANSIDAADAELNMFVALTSRNGLETTASHLRTLGRDLRRELPAVDNIFLFDRTGKMRAGTVSGVSSEVSIADRQEFQEARSNKTQSLRITPPRPGKVTGDVVTILLKRLEEPTGEFAGVVSATIGPGHFDALFSSLSLPGKSAILLAHINGTVITRFPKSPAIGTSFTNRPLFSEHLKQAPSGTFLSPPQSDGEIRIVAYEQVSSGPFVLAAALHMGEALAPWRERSYFSAGFLVAFAFLAFVNANFLIRRSRVQARQADTIKESEARFRDLTELSVDWYWETDMEQRLTYVSDSESLKSLGLTPDMLKGVSRSERVESKEAEDVVRQAQEAMEKGLPFIDLQRPVKLKNGNTVWISISGRPMHDRNGEIIGYRGTARNVTSAVAAARAIREQRELLRLIIQNVPTTVYLKDLEGRYLLVNDRQCDFLGFSREELEGHRLTDLTDAAWAQHFEDNDRKVLENRQVEEFDTQMSVNGEVREFHVFKFPVFGLDGDLVGLGGINLDTTEQKRLEARLSEAEKMNAVGQLTGGIAHDFNNILAVVIGDLEMALAEPDRQKRTSLVMEALEAAEKSADLTHKLLAFARRAPLVPRSFDAAQTLRGNASMLQSAVPERINLHLNIAESTDPIAVDESQLLSAVLNLIINSRDAIEGSGDITLTVQGAHLDSERLRTRRNKIVHGLELIDEARDYVSIAVSDNGKGIPASDLDKVFEPFYTTKKTGEGSGLGLSMVNGFCAQSGGGLIVETEEDQGTTFTLIFPIVDENSQTETNFRLKSEDAADFSGKVVLLVEDDPMVCKMARQNLEKLGFDVFTASTGEEAVEFLKSDRPLDLLITDGVLPGDIQGPRIALRAKDLRPNIKTILVSGYPTEELERVGGLIAFDQMLTKPFRKMALVKTISRALAD